MTEDELREIKRLQRAIRELYWKACRSENVAGELEALDFEIECVFFGYEGD